MNILLTNLFFCIAALSKGDGQETTDGGHVLSRYVAHEEFHTKLDNYIGKKINETTERMLKYLKIERENNDQFLAKIDSKEYAYLQIILSMTTKDHAFSRVLIDSVVPEVGIDERNGIDSTTEIQLPLDDMLNIADAVVSSKKYGLGKIPSNLEARLLSSIDHSKVLNEASKKGDLEIVDWILKSGKNFTIDSALENARENQQWYIFSLLLASEKDYDPEILSRINGTGNESELIDPIPLSKIKNTSSAGRFDCFQSGEKPLLFVASEEDDFEAAKRLLDKGADPNLTNAKGDTALHAAVAKGHFNIVKLLVEYGSTIQKENDLGVTPVRLGNDHCISGIIDYIISRNHSFAKSLSQDHELRFWFNYANSVKEIECERNDTLSPLLSYSKIIKYFKNAGAVDSNAIKTFLVLLQVVLDHGIEEILPVFEILIGEWINVSDRGAQFLFSAVKSGKNRTVRFVLDQGIAANIKGEDDITALHLAAGYGNVDIVNLFLGYSPDENARTKNGDSVLHAAARGGKVDVVRLLIEKGFRLNVGNNREESPLHLASKAGHYEVVKLLVDRGAHLTAKDVELNTPMHVAALFGHTSVVQYFLDKLVDIDMVNGREETALYLASMKGHQDVVKTLVRMKANLYTRNIDGWMALHVAAREGRLLTVTVLLKAGADINVKNGREETPVYLAARDGHLNVTELLIKHKADLSIVNMHGWTPLHAAATEGWLSTVRLLLDNGLDIEVRNHRNETPIYVSSINGKESVVELLLDRGADMYAKNKDGWMPIHTAAFEGQASVVKAYIKRGIDVNVPNSYRNETALYLAAHRGHSHIVKMLIEGDADKGRRNIDGWMPVHVASKEGRELATLYLISNGADINSKNYLGQTPLHLASLGGHQRIVDSLLQLGADTALMDAVGQTPLHAAAQGGNANIVKTLVEQGAEVDVKDMLSRTPLYEALSNEQCAAARALVSEGASLDVRSKGATSAKVSLDLGSTPRDLLVENNGQLLKQAIACDC